MKSLAFFFTFIFACIFAFTQVWAAPAEAEVIGSNLVPGPGSSDEYQAFSRMYIDLYNTFAKNYIDLYMRALGSSNPRSTPFPPFPPPPTFPPFPPFPPSRR